MKFNSAVDILKFAATKEEASVQFYRSLTKHVKDLNTVATLEMMARQEEQHIEAIKLELLKLGYAVKDSDAQKEDAVALEIDPKVGEMTTLDFMRLGIQKERAAFNLYSELMVMAEDISSRKMFMELAEEEMRHVISLEREVEVLIQPHKQQ